MAPPQPREPRKVAVGGHRAAGTLRLLKDDWAEACSLLEHGIAVFRTGNVVILLPSAVASSAWILAQLGEARLG